MNINTDYSPSEWFHRSLYLSVQKLRGRHVGSHIRALREWERLDAEAFRRLHTARLAETLNYVRDHVPLYAPDRWWRGSRQADPADLHSWPVLNRETIQQREAELLAHPRSTRLTYHSTSGSTGRPLRVALDPAADAWVLADFLRPMLWFGVRPGSKRIMLSASSGSSSLLNWVRNTKEFPARNLSRARLAEALDTLIRSRPAYVWGLPSAMVQLARCAQTAAPVPGPLVPYVRLYGEMVFPFQREEIEQGLGARVIETYGCGEIGMIAHECPAGSLHVLDECVHVEILRDGEPVEPGESGEVAVTVFTNRAMPLVRYQVGDRARLSVEPCSCGRPHPVIEAIEGRIGDVLPAADGTPVHGNVLGYGLRDILEQAPPGALGQVLFEQNDPRSWRVFVEAGPGFDDRIAAQLVEVVRGSFGASCKVEVQRVAEIPREPSGKFRYYRRAVEETSQDGGALPVTAD